MSSTPLLPGTVVRNKWTIGPLLDRGPITTRYAATYRTGHPVVLEILERSWSRDSELRAGFLRASYLANRVDHPAVVRVLDDGVTEDELAFVVTDRFDGETLGERMTRMGGRIPRLEMYDSGDRLLDAVAAAHECGVIHGDLRPVRVLLTVKGELRVSGFGSGRLLSTRFPTAESLRWSPPEASVAGGTLDARSDLWALAGCLYAAITGQFAPGEEGRVAPLQTLAADAPLETGEAIDRGLARDRGGRWQTARQMQQAWRVAWAADDGVREVTMTDGRRPSHPRSEDGRMDPSLAAASPRNASPSGGADATAVMKREPSTSQPPQPSSDSLPGAASTNPRMASGGSIRATPTTGGSGAPPAPLPAHVIEAVMAKARSVPPGELTPLSETSLSAGNTPGGHFMPTPLQHGLVMTAPLPTPTPPPTPPTRIVPIASMLAAAELSVPVSSVTDPDAMGAARDAASLQALGIGRPRRGTSILVAVLAALLSFAVVGFLAREIVVFFFSRSSR